MGKLIEHPEAIVARLRKDTTQVAGVIDREMKALQKKYPDHFFELSFELERLGSKKFYKIRIKSFNDVKEQSSSPTPTQQLIGFIIDQKLDINEYNEKLPTLIKKKFIVSHHSNPNKKPVEDLVQTIIDWEQGSGYTSLEETINSYYAIKPI